MTVALEGAESLSSAWMKFDEVNKCLRHYLQTSEDEFASLIQALDVCWNMAEAVHKASVQLGEFSDDALSSQTAVIRESLLEACGVFKNFLAQVEEERRQLAVTAKQTGLLLATSTELQSNIAPLKHVAFHFRLEASRLSSEEGAFLEKAYEGTKQVMRCMQQAGDSQRVALHTILDKLSLAVRSVEETCSSYGVRAEESEQKVTHSLTLLSAAPRDLQRVKNEAKALGTVLTKSIGEAVKALQGHDAIRQRLEHILAGLASLRDGEDQSGTVEPGHALLLQRRQAASVMELVIKTGSLIQRELNIVIGFMKSIAGDGSASSSDDAEVESFEKGVDHLASLSAEVAGLLKGEATMGHFVVSQIAPIRQMLSSNSRETEKLAGSMKVLALNVLIASQKIPSAKGLGVLGVWTANTAEEVLRLATHQNDRLRELRATLESQTGRIAAQVEKVESCLNAFAAEKATDALRNSRREEFGTVGRLSTGAGQLQSKTEALMQSMKFVDEGRELLGCLDRTIDCLLTLYPKPERPFDIDSASAGYTMQQQHDTHGLVSGEAAGDSAPLAQPAEGQEYGNNVELF